MDRAVITEVTDRHFELALPTLEDYIRIPAKSPAFDPDWQTNGHIAAAVELIRNWCVAHAPEGASVEVRELAGRTPLLVVDLPASDANLGADTVLLYGHLDKQPEMTGWDDGLGPWTPVLREGRLYGRGGGDDGYSAFAIMAALDAVRSAGGKHRRCVAVIEASEESGSPDLPAHLNALGDSLGDVSLVICLDSGAPAYDAMWMTTSLRGLVQAELRVDVLERGMHSGIVGGLAPSSMRIMRTLLDRIEDPVTGRVLIPEFHVEVPADRLAEAKAAAADGVDPRLDVRFSGSTRSDAHDAVGALVTNTWEPSMATIGIDGIPSLADAGNVLRPFTTVGLSFRLPPTCDPAGAITALHEVVTNDPPNEATVELTVLESSPGWNAAPTLPWLSDALDAASTAHFGKPTGSWGIGGSIPFMAMLGERYPRAQFVITGVLGPGSNAHGPNEFLDLATARRISACMAEVIGAHSAS
ncbi:MAG: M20/M25/M40 family metallo-hydrolase [Acidimicrobiales bacterium]